MRQEKSEVLKNKIKCINENDNWIIEGTLRKNLYYLLELAEKIIYLEISKKTRNIRIFIRYIKQKLRIEKSSYEPTIKMLQEMYRWSNEHENNKYELERSLNMYKEKLEIINKKTFLTLTKEEV